MRKDCCSKCGCYIPSGCACRVSYERERRRYGVKPSPAPPEWLKQELQREYTR